MLKMRIKQHYIFEHKIKKVKSLIRLFFFGVTMTTAILPLSHQNYSFGLKKYLLRRFFSHGITERCIEKNSVVSVIIIYTSSSLLSLLSRPKEKEISSSFFNKFAMSEIIFSTIQ